MVLLSRVKKVAYVYSSIEKKLKKKLVTVILFLLFVLRRALLSNELENVEQQLEAKVS